MKSMTNKNLYRSLPVIFAGAILMLIAQGVLAAQTFTVTNTNDSGTGSLRRAILETNANPGLDVIAFNIPAWGRQAGTRKHTIQPLTPLPHITDPVIIDGYTQPGAAPATDDAPATLLIELDGINVIGLHYDSGLMIHAHNSTVRGLAVNRFGDVGIHIGDPVGGNIIEGNYIGTDVTGTLERSNFDGGVRIWDTPNNRIGGTAPAARNVISANQGACVGILLPGATGNEISRNYIGTDATGTAALGNAVWGVLMYEGASDNTIGPGNVISANGGGGIEINGVGVTGNQILGNFIGTDTSGTEDLGNTNGVRIISCSDNTLTDNTVSNNGYGIQLQSSSDNQIYNNNFIGNTTQAYATTGRGGNIFNREKPTGGNYWSDWTTPDADGDGFVDSPYVFSGGVDYLPWARQDDWPPPPPPPPPSIPPDIAVADPNLIGWWKFDEGSGTIAYDSSGNGLDGIFEGNPEWVSGQLGGALEFDGDDCVNVGNPHDLAITEAISIACWVNPTGFVGRQSFVGLFMGYAFKVHELGRLCFTTPRFLDHESANTILEAGTWQHVTVTFQPGQNNGVVFYLNGVETDRLNSSAMDPGSGPFLIGSNQWGENFTGIIDDVRVYDHLLTKSEVLVAMEGGEGYPYASSPVPADGATGVTQTPALRWTAGDRAFRHDVYFGTDEQAVRNANMRSPEYKDSKDLGSESYEPGKLEWNTAYYWRVDEYNTDATISEGRVWSFETAGAGGDTGDVLTQVVYDQDHTTNGLLLDSGGDVDTEVVSVGSPPEQALRTGNGQVLPSTNGNRVEDYYMQFRIDDEFIFRGSPTSRVQIEIEYLDEGTDTFNIHYDAISGGHEGDGRFKGTGVVVKTNSGEFKTAVFSLCDAYFGNRDNGADFRIADGADGAEVIRRVAVNLLAPKSGPVTHYVDSCGANPHDDQPDSDAIQACIDRACSGDTVLFTSGVNSLGYQGYIIDKTVFLVKSSGKSDLTFSSTDPDNHALLTASPDLLGFVVQLFARSGIGNGGSIDNITFNHIDVDDNRAERKCYGADGIGNGRDDHWGSWVPECQVFDDAWCSPGALSMAGQVDVTDPEQDYLAHPERWSTGLVVRDVTLSNTECGTALALWGAACVIDSVNIYTAGDHVHRQGCEPTDPDEAIGGWSDGITSAGPAHRIINNFIIDASDIGIVTFGGRDTIIANNTIIAQPGNNGMFAGIAVHPFVYGLLSDFQVVGNHVINEADPRCGGIHAGINIGTHMWNAGCAHDPTPSTVGDPNGCSSLSPPPGWTLCVPGQPCRVWGHIPEGATFTLADNTVTGAQVNFLVEGMEILGKLIVSGNVSNSPQLTDWTSDDSCTRDGITYSWGALDFVAHDPTIEGWTDQRIYCER